MTEIKTFADDAAVAKAAAQHFYASYQRAIEVNGRFAAVLSGGSTPRKLHKEIVSNYKDQIDWSKVHLFWGDERTVPPENQDSNYRMAKETLLEHVSISADNIHRIHAEHDPSMAASSYEREIRAFFGDSRGIPSFDLIFLGMGDDGHTASLFPKTAALDEKHRLVTENWVEQQDTWRVTMTYPLINAARETLFLVTGQNKAPALTQVITGERQPDLYPSQLINPTDGELYWYVDEAAASAL